jgi:CheY-like chemotaxis protein
MEKKIKCVLLIDDDEITNFINENALRRLDVVEEIIAVQSGFEALEFLNEVSEKQQGEPELIFLDINMPGMSGWEFLEEYKNLDPSLQKKMTIIMLSTSFNPDDKAMAETIKEISEFRNKPLTIEAIEQILASYHKNHSKKLN